MKPCNPQTSHWRFWDINSPPSFHGLRSKLGMLLQGVYPDPRGRNRKGLSGTSVMPVLSQMIRARDVSLKDALWASVKTPVFSHQSLRMIVFDHIKTVRNSNSTRSIKMTKKLRRYRSPSRIFWNCVAIRQANRGPTLPPRTNGSATPASHTSIFSGVP